MEQTQTTPNYNLESALSGVVCGVDEAGRGPWAGPVVAAAAILDPGNIPAGLNDSKKLTKAKRELLFPLIIQSAQTGIGIASVQEIDALNILGATKLAMQRAVEQLPYAPDYALIDGNQPPKLICQTQAIIKGDSKSLSIAAASIIAKVTRDRMMEQLGQQYPEYGFEQHAGYGTKQHQAGLLTYGITEQHRKSFKPIKALLKNLP